MFFDRFRPCEHMRKHAFAGGNTQQVLSTRKYLNSLEDAQNTPVETCVLKPKQNPLPVVLLPKKEANKYSDNLYSISVTLLYLEFWIRRPDHTPLLFIMNAYLCLKK